MRKIYPLYITCGILMIVFGLFMLFHPRECPTDNAMHYSSIMFETVAHLPTSDFPEYTQVWADTETDRAVYIKNNYVPTQIVIEGDKVSFNDIVAAVISTDEQGFEIELPDDQLAEYGMSGSVVSFNDTPIALVSKATSLSTIYCIYY